MAFVTDSNRPQPLWRPPPTACPTASGAASEVLPFSCAPGRGGASRGCAKAGAGGWNSGLVATPEKGGGDYDAGEGGGACTRPHPKPPPPARRRGPGTHAPQPWQRMCGGNPDPRPLGAPSGGGYPTVSGPSVVDRSGGAAQKRPPAFHAQRLRDRPPPPSRPSPGDVCAGETNDWRVAIECEALLRIAEGPRRGGGGGGQGCALCGAGGHPGVALPVLRGGGTGVWGPSTAPHGV